MQARTGLHGVCNNRRDDGAVQVLTESDVKELLTIEDAIEAVEKGFALQAQGAAVMPPKNYMELPEFNGDFRAMPAYIDGVAGVKWVSVYPDNHRCGQPSVLATIILNDPATGQPLAVMDGTYITGLRTGAAGAVAVKYLARKGSKTIGITGAGAQARMQLLAVSKVMPEIELVKVYDLQKNTAEQYVREMGRILGFEIKNADSLQEAADADIVITTTPSRSPYMREDFIKPGTHINAIGADAQGKQELRSSLTAKARIIVDDIKQACHSGEINVPISEGAISRQDIAGTIGEVITGKIAGRRNDKEITVFDSTGLAIQDIICAKYVYQKICGEG